MPPRAAATALALAAAGAPARAQRCAFARRSGLQENVECHDIRYDLYVPDVCAAGSACGVIFDVHGAIMSGPWNDAITEMRRYSGAERAIIVQPTAGPGNPPLSSWPGSAYCADRMLLALDDVEAAFDVDTSRVYMGGFSQGGWCTDDMMGRPEARRFAAFMPWGATIGAPAGRARVPFIWFTSRYDATNGSPQSVYDRVAEYQREWALTVHERVSAGPEHEHWRYSAPDGSAEVELVMHNYTCTGIPPISPGHCGTGGADAPPNSAFVPLVRLSAPQPDPSAAEIHTGAAARDFYRRHVRPDRAGANATGEPPAAAEERRRAWGAAEAAARAAAAAR